MSTLNARFFVARRPSGQSVAKPCVVSADCFEQAWRENYLRVFQERVVHSGESCGSLCADVRYLAEADFAERAEAFTREIEAKKIELAKVEEQERRRLERKCLRPGADGGYEIADKARRAEAETTVWQGNPAVKVDESHRAPTMTVDELVARCRDDPEALWLSNMDMQDHTRTWEPHRVSLSFCFCVCVSSLSSVLPASFSPFVLL